MGIRSRVVLVAVVAAVAVLFCTEQIDLRGLMIVLGVGIAIGLDIVSIITVLLLFLSKALRKACRTP